MTGIEIGFGSLVLDFARNWNIGINLLPFGVILGDGDERTVKVNTHYLFSILIYKAHNGQVMLQFELVYFYGGFVTLLKGKR